MAETVTPAEGQGYHCRMLGDRHWDRWRGGKGRWMGRSRYKSSVGAGWRDADTQNRLGSGRHTRGAPTPLQDQPAAETAAGRPHPRRAVLCCAGGSQQRSAAESRGTLPSLLCDNGWAYETPDGRFTGIWPCPDLFHRGDPRPAYAYICRARGCDGQKNQGIRFKKIQETKRTPSQPLPKCGCMNTFTLPIPSQPARTQGVPGFCPSAICPVSR